MKRRSIWNVMLVGCALVLACGFAPAQATWRVSVDSSGIEGNANAWLPSISRDGRFVAFESLASNLVPGDTNGTFDVFAHDRQTGTTTRVSVDSSGVQGSANTWWPSISGDGRFVAFGSQATNLVPGDTNGSWDVFVHDRQTGTTRRVSVGSSGGQGNWDSGVPSISGDARFVAFESYASNLVPGDTNGFIDVFVHDRQTGTTTRISVDSSGVEGNLHSGLPSVSGDGRFVAFWSRASNLVPRDSNRYPDVFRHDRKSGTTTRVSIGSAGVEANNRSSWPSISGDGRFVAFGSHASNLVWGDTNGEADVFVHDRQTGTTTRVSVDSSGVQGDSWSHQPSITGDGRFVAFDSSATNLVPGDTNGWPDVFVHDRQIGTTTRVSVDSWEIQGNSQSREPSISGDGRFVAFQSVATNLVPSDNNGFQDVFVHGPYLTLEASPETVSAGATLTLTSWGGQPGGLVLLAAVDVNGTPLFVPLVIRSFDRAGLWSLAEIVPPGLSGIVVTFLSVGVTPTAKLGLTNLQAITFQ